MNENALEVQVERHPNPHCATWHVRCCLTDCMIHLYESKQRMKREAADGRPLLQKILGKMGVVKDDWAASRREAKKILPLCESLFAIEGVNTVSVKPYEIGISKARTFSWMELEPQIEDAINTYLASIAK
jgi:hypothetical protein